MQEMTTCLHAIHLLYIRIFLDNYIRIQILEPLINSN